MPSVADYIIITDGSFTLGVNQERTFTFSLSGTISNVAPIIAFQVDPANNSNLSFAVEINDQQVYNATTSVTIRRGIWEVFGLNILDTNGNNTVQFRVESGTGTITFSDVILWYKRQV